MNIDLNNCPPKLRERIQRQIDQEDAAKANNPTRAISPQPKGIADRSPGLCADDQEPTQRSSLVGIAQREAARWYGPAVSFEIVFRVYSQRPADWDGYEVKQLQDMVVHSGILPDDNWRILQGRVIPNKAHSKEEERVEIEIVPL